MLLARSAAFALRLPGGADCVAGDAVVLDRHGSLLQTCATT
ncbi:MAG TPA: hypothetical protein VFW88_00365 [Burkholderiales bacterium]|nr:hypothetical protein [Burkholderiales bacterium]